MDNQVEEFKQFARKYPGLKYEVRSGKATWQSIFEEWYLYGEEDSQWEKFKEIPKDTVASKETVTADEKSSSDSKSSTSTMSGAEMMTQAFQYIQKMDMNKVQQTMGTVQKFIQLFQTFQGSGGAGAGASLGAAASQRQSFPGLFSKFDD